MHHGFKFILTSRAPDWNKIIDDALAKAGEEDRRLLILAKARYRKYCEYMVKRERERDNAL